MAPACRSANIANYRAGSTGAVPEWAGEHEGKSGAAGQNMSYWLVTGGAGFIGSNLTRQLALAGHKVHVLDNLASGRIDNLAGIRHSFHRGSVVNANLVSDLVSRAHGIFHLAARVSVQDCISEWHAGHQDNMVGTLNVLDAAARAGGIPVIYASSAAVYGDTGQAPGRETDREMPISPYGADKLGAEHHARSFGIIHELPTLGLRFYNVYGRGQSAGSPYSGVIPLFLRNALEGRPHTIFGDGLQARDFVHVEDVVGAMMAGMDRLQDGRISGSEVCNVCTGQPTTLRELALAVDRAVDAPARPIEYRPARRGDIRWSAGDPSRMRDLLGYAAGITLDQGLERTFAPLVNAEAVA